MRSLHARTVTFDAIQPSSTKVSLVYLKMDLACATHDKAQTGEYDSAVVVPVQRSSLHTSSTQVELFKSSFPNYLTAATVSHDCSADHKINHIE